MGQHEREMIAVKIEGEERWAYDRRQERLSLHRMSELSALPVAEGGLGYPLSVKVLKTRIDAYFSRIRDSIQTGVHERRARQEAEIDELIRLAVSDITRARAEGDVKASAEAEARLLKYQEREAKLFGVDAPQQIHTTLETRDGDLAELNAMLAEAGLEPVESESPA